MKEKLLNFLFPKYIKLHYIINDKLDIKNVMHFVLGILAGGVMAYGFVQKSFAIMIISLAVFSGINALFHKLFYSIPHTQVVVSVDEENEENVEEAVTSALEKVTGDDYEQINPDDSGE